MAITYVGGKVLGRANPSSAVDVAIDSGLTGGSGSAALADDIVIVAAVTGSAGGTPAMAVTTPTGYAALGQENRNDTADTSMDVSWKIMGSTPDTTVTIPGTGNNAFGEAYAIMVFRGVNLTTPMDAAAVHTGGIDTGRPDPPSITPATDGACVVIAGGGASGTHADFVAPANYTTDFLTDGGADTTDACVGMGYRLGLTGGVAENPALFTGGTTGTGDSWAAYTLALRPAAEAVSVGVTGNEGTGGFGAFAAAVVLALSGVSGTGAVGTVAPSATVAITGEVATGAPGTVVPSAGFSVALTGEVGTVSSGSLAASVSAPLSGEAGTGAVGTLVHSVGFNVALDGNGATGAIGSLEPAVAAAMSGTAGTGSVGTVVPSASYSAAVTGNQVAGAAGSVAAQVSAPLSGEAVTGAVGTLSPSAGFMVALSGNTGTGAAGSLATSASIALSGASGTGAEGSLSPAMIVVLAGNSAAGDVGTLTPMLGAPEPDIPWFAGVRGSGPGILNVRGGL